MTGPGLGARARRLGVGVLLSWGAVMWACTDEPVQVQAPPPELPDAGAPSHRGRAHLARVSGEVMVKRAAGDDWMAAEPGMQLYENDKVRTAQGASALLDFHHGSSVTLGPEALIAIAETRARPGFGRSDLTVIRGRVDAELEDPNGRSLSVTTPAAQIRAGREIVFQ